MKNAIKSKLPLITVSQQLNANIRDEKKKKKQPSGSHRTAPEPECIFSVFSRNTEGKTSNMYNVHISFVQIDKRWNVGKHLWCGNDKSDNILLDFAEMIFIARC